MAELVVNGSRTDDCRVLVFARAPEPGRVKTRLAPVLGGVGAAALHRRLVAHALEHAREAALGPVELWCAPDASHEFFTDCARAHGVALHAQPDGDLGARMRHAFEAALGRAPRALLIGSDVPGADAELLRAAHTALDSAPAVFAPAEDGGYGLIGLSRLLPALFEAMPWGGDTVMAETRERLRAAGWNWSELGAVWDVDRPADLSRLAREYPQLAARPHAL